MGCYVRAIAVRQCCKEATSTPTGTLWHIAQSAQHTRHVFGSMADGIHGDCGALLSRVMAFPGVRKLVPGLGSLQSRRPKTGRGANRLAVPIAAFQSIGVRKSPRHRLFVAEQRRRVQLASRHQCVQPNRVANAVASLFIHRARADMR
jgi:hypothetical protein